MNKPPKYYPTSCIEPVDVIEVWNLNFNLGNAIKYIARAGKKIGGQPAHFKADGTLVTDDGNEIPVTGAVAVPESVQLAWSRMDDLQKAINYLYREVNGCWPWECDWSEEE